MTPWRLPRQRDCRPDRRSRATPLTPLLSFLFLVNLCLNLGLHEDLRDGLQHVLAMGVGVQGWGEVDGGKK